MNMNCGCVNGGKSASTKVATHGAGWNSGVSALKGRCATSTLPRLRCTAMLVIWCISGNYPEGFQVAGMRLACQHPGNLPATRQGHNMAATFTKSHVEELAAIVRTAKVRQAYGDIDILRFFETEIADSCARSNPNFDRERFAAACVPRKVAA